MSSSSSELLLLKWNSYETIYHSAFSEFRETNKFYDVTIATHDGHVLAHRVILSACSPVLAKILNLTSHNQPLIYIHGVTTKHISTILDFMYKGEARVSHDTIVEFLATAEELKVKGLSKDNREGEDQAKTRDDICQKDNILQNGLQKDSISQNDDITKNGLQQRDMIQNKLQKDIITSRNAPYQDNQDVNTFIKKENNFVAESDEEVIGVQKSKEGISTQINSTSLSTPNFEKILLKNMASSTPIRIRSPKTINDDFDGKNNNTVIVKNKDIKRKSEIHKKIESVIDSVLQQTDLDGEISPKVRKISPDINEDYFLVDSDGAPILDSFQEYDHFLAQSKSLSLGDSCINDKETKNNGDPDEKIILTKSSEDKARFRAIVATMITKSASNEGGFDCLVCGKHVTNATSHVDHMHTDNILHKCHVCGKIKNTSVALGRHIKLHK